MTWDCNLDYEQTRKRIKNVIDHEVARAKKKVIPRKKLGFFIIFAIQLRNGLRISEAIDAYVEFQKIPLWDQKEVTIKVRKKKHVVTKPAYYPRWVNSKAMGYMKAHFPSWRPSVQSCSNACRKYLHATTHSLRYARITYMAEQGVNPTLIAKATRHSQLSYVFHYTQQKKADEVAKNLE